MRITKEDEVKINKLLQALDESRSKSMHFLQKGKFRTSALHFNNEARTSDELSELLNEIAMREKRKKDEKMDTENN